MPIEMSLLSFVAGLITTVFVILNFIKSREQNLGLDVLGNSPTIINIYYENLSHSDIHDLEISWEVYLRKGYKIINDKIISGVVLNARKKGEKSINIYSADCEKGEELKSRSNSHYGFIEHVKINYKYKILYKFTECGSYHFKLETVGEDGELIPEKARKWKQELEKTMVKHWWQFWKPCPPVLERTLEDLRDVEKKEREEQREETINEDSITF